MASKIIAPCKLCDTVNELRDSHIVPKWVYRRLVNLHDESTPPVRIGNGTAALNGQQASEHMLCGACEELFGKSET